MYACAQACGVIEASLLNAVWCGQLMPKKFQKRFAFAVAEELKYVAQNRYEFFGDIDICDKDVVYARLAKYFQWLKGRFNSGAMVGLAFRCAQR